MTDVILEANHLRKEFGGLVAVNGVTLHVERGSIHSIIGPNGAGKTTLFNMLSGKYKPTTGSVTFNGTDVTQLPPFKRARMGMGRSYQITNIFPNLTVLENVRLAIQRDSNVWANFLRLKEAFTHHYDQAHAILKTVRLAEDAETVANSLPHGGKRKLELAILLATDPELMLLDEPTAGMASEQVPELIDVIDSIRKEGNRTVMLVEHNMNVVMGISSRITVMNYGSVIAEGTPDEISRNETVQSVYLGGFYESLDTAGAAHGG
ncbi:MAG: ABC transporter ATP-binding protein [Chloroflexota bacterium]